MAIFTEGYFTNGRSQKLYYRAWDAPGVTLKAFLVFHHGYGSHCNAYENELRQWTEAGIRVFAFDAHSFGRSEPLDPAERSLIQNFNHLTDDVYLFRKEIVDPQQPSTPVPVFMGGLSMGGMTSILVGIREQSAWQGLVLLSPAVDCERNFVLKIMEVIQGVLLRIAPNIRIVPQPVIPNITLNPEERQSLAKDEFFDPKKIRVRSGNTFLSAWTHISQNERQLRLPILIHYSTIDKIVYPPATERFARNVASEDVTIKGFEKFAHDIYLDTSKEESCSEVLQWILAHSTTGPTGSAAKL